MKRLIMLMAALTLAGCSSMNFDKDKAKDYQARSAVYCGKNDTSKYVDLGNMLVMVCQDGRSFMLED